MANSNGNLNIVQPALMKQPTESSSASPPSTTATTSSTSDIPNKMETCLTSPSNKLTSKPLPICEICQKVQSLYKCPRCHIRTCSLTCCKQHKLIQKCNGTRNRGEFLYLKDFDDSVLANDYHFLEDVLKAEMGGRRMLKHLGAEGNRVPKRNMDEEQNENQPVPIQPLLEPMAKKTKVVNGVDSSPDLSSLHIATTESDDKNDTSNEVVVDDWLGRCNPMQRKLVLQARERGCNLLLMPNGMDKRKNNNTSYNSKKDLIAWKVDWIFHHKPQLVPPNNNNNNNEKEKEEAVQMTHRRKNLLTTQITNKIPESANSIGVELNKHIDITPYNTTTRSHLKQTFASSSSSSSSSKPPQKMHVLMKQLPSHSNQKKYIEFDLNVTLRENLKGCTIIEYPTLEIVLEEHLSYFPRLIQEVDTGKSVDKDTETAVGKDRVLVEEVESNQPVSSTT